MTNLEKLNSIFCEVFSVETSALGSDFNKDNVDGWDSVRQLSLTSAVTDKKESKRGQSRGQSSLFRTPGTLHFTTIKS